MIKIDDKTVRKKISSKKDEIIEWVKSLIRFSSENRFPYGNEGEAQEFIQEECLKIGLKTDVFSPEEVIGIKNDSSWLKGRDYSNNRNNVVVKWKGIGKGKSLLFNGHIDVAPFEPDNWKICRPYEPVEKNGRLYGRGAEDMKSGLASAYWAIRILKEIGFNPEGDIYFESVVDEEFAGGNGTLASRLRGYNTDMAVLTEPTSMQVCTACLGAFLGDFTIKVKKGMSPRINPIYGAARVIELFKEWEKHWRSENRHNLFKGKGKELNLGLRCIDSKVPGEFAQMANPIITKISWIIWSYPGMTESKFYKRFIEFWKNIFKKDPVLKSFEFEIEPAFHYIRPWESDSDYQGIQKLAEAYKIYTKKNPVISGAPICCDMAICGDQGNMPAVVLGPRGGNRHSSDEWVMLEDIYELIGIFIMFINNWCSQ